MKSDEQEIRQLVAAWMAATKAGDIETVLGLMADDVVFLMPGRPLPKRHDPPNAWTVPRESAQPESNRRTGEGPPGFVSTRVWPFLILSLRQAESPQNEGMTKGAVICPGGVNPPRRVTLL